MKKKYQSIFFAILNTFLGLILVFYPIRLPVIDEVEEKVYKYSFKLKQYFRVNSEEQYLDKENLVFIDTSNDIEVVKSNETNRNEVVVSRRALLQCLNKLKPFKNRLKFIICDIALEAAEDSNTAFLDAVKYFDKKKIFAQNNISNRPQNIPKASTVVDILSGKLLTYNLLHKSTPTLPLEIYLKIHSSQKAKVFSSIFDSVEVPFLKIGNRYYFKELIVEPKVSKSDLEPKSFDDSLSTNPVMFFELADYTNFADSTNTLNKIIVIANLNEKGNDIHEDLLGKTYGSLFLMNTYFGIRDGVGQISFMWLLFIFISFFFFFYEAQIHQIDYFKHMKRNSALQNLKNYIKLILNKINNFFFYFLKQILKLTDSKINFLKKYCKLDIFSILGLVLLLAIIVFISFLVFNVHIRFIHCWFIVIFEKLLFKSINFLNKFYHA